MNLKNKFVGLVTLLATLSSTEQTLAGKIQPPMSYSFSTSKQTDSTNYNSILPEEKDIRKGNNTPILYEIIGGVISALLIGYYIFSEKEETGKNNR